VALSVSLVLATGLGAESLDRKLYEQIHDRWQRSWLDRPMELATDAGDAKLGIALCAGIGLFGGPKARQSAKLALAADALSAGVTYGLKMAVNRDRPEGETQRSNSSFPSGHATGAFALATVFSHQYPKVTVPAFLAAAAVGVSRVYLGRHYPSDILGGALVGFGSACLIIHYKESVLGLTLPGLSE
jgi:undecaprenyl-diphosphatase